MKKYSDMSKEELLTLKAQLDKEYADIKAKGLALDMSRGKRSETGYVQRKTVSRPARSLNGINERIKQRFRPQV